MKTIQKFVASLVSGVLSAFFFVGIGGRVAMRLLATLSNQQMDFNVDGTIAALVFSTSIGMVGGSVFPLVADYIPGGPTTKGSYFGLLVFVVLIPMLPTAVQAEASSLGQYIPLAITLFGLLLMGYGVSLEFLSRKLGEISRISPGDKSRKENMFTQSHIPTYQSQ